jgi:hypothetical protein
MPIIVDRLKSCASLSSATLHNAVFSSFKLHPSLYAQFLKQYLFISFLFSPFAINRRNLLCRLIVGLTLV